MEYAGIIVDISHVQLDKTFTYAIPAQFRDQVEVGTKVIIPFGSSIRSGYVVEEVKEPTYDLSKIKPIAAVDDGSVSVDEKLIRLAYWIKSNYGGTIWQALATVIPVKDKVRRESQRSIKLLISPQEAREMALEYAKKHRAAQARLLIALSENPVADYALLNQKLNISMATVSSLENQGILELESITLFRNAVDVKAGQKKEIVLNDAQQGVVNGIVSEMDAGDETPCLIKGVTGSGKTEVYMELIAHAVNSGKEAIVLIPEIALTYQNVMRFYERFGNQVSIIHSRLSKGEKYDRFDLARVGKIKVMIGPRSALFTPFQNLGLIIIDEEHEGAYQGDQVPKYHARETAIALAKLYHGKVVLGSATPSMEAYYRAQNGEYHFYELKERAGAAKLPQVHIVDLREELRKGNRSIFSNTLQDMMEERLQKNEPMMLFLNRRGSYGLVTCRDCGKTLECPHCAVSLNVHSDGQLVCHYCGYEEKFTKICPHCGSKHIGTFKAGTQTIEDEVKRLFPRARVLRMDADSTKGKDGHAKILEQFAAGEADVLVGTQMIVKGHDFPRVTLMGILLADISLHVPEYMAAERTFELLTQAAGRAGRGDLPGEVVFQTYDPEHYAITHAANQDYEGFYEEEIAFRQMMDYPPLSHMMSVKVMSEDEARMDDAALHIKELTKSMFEKDRLRIIGPANAAVYKVNDVYCKIIYYKHADYSLLTRVKDEIESELHTNEGIYKKCTVHFDFR